MAMAGPRARPRTDGCKGAYRQRFAIATSYRQLRRARVRTCRRDLLRLLYVGVGPLFRGPYRSVNSAQARSSPGSLSRSSKFAREVGASCMRPSGGTHKPSGETFRNGKDFRGGGRRSSYRGRHPVPVEGRRAGRNVWVWLHGEVLAERRRGSGGCTWAA